MQNPKEKTSIYICCLHTYTIKTNSEFTSRAQVIFVVCEGVKFETWFWVFSQRLSELVATVNQSIVKSVKRFGEN